MSNWVGIWFQWVHDWGYPGIVILKGLPVLQCASCPQYLLEDAVLARVDQILSRVDGGIELEIIRYAA